MISESFLNFSGSFEVVQKKARCKYHATLLMTEIVDIIYNNSAFVQHIIRTEMFDSQQFHRLRDVNLQRNSAID